MAEVNREISIRQNGTESNRDRSYRLVNLVKSADSSNLEYVVYYLDGHRRLLLSLIFIPTSGRSDYLYMCYVMNICFVVLQTAAKAIEATLRGDGEGGAAAAKCPSREEKSAACRNVATLMCCRPVTERKDFARILSLAIRLFLKLHGDEDRNMWTVVEESLGAMVKELLPSQGGGMVHDLFNFMKGRISQTPPRSLRAAVRLFGEICHALPPGKKSRKLMKSLHAVVQHMYICADESVHAAIAQMVENVSSVLIFYLREREAHALLALFSRNLKSANPAIRYVQQNILPDRRTLAGIYCRGDMEISDRSPGGGMQTMLAQLNGR